MILIVTTHQHRYTHASVQSESDANVRVISYRELEARVTTLPAGTYVFTDVDRLNSDALRQAAVYFRDLQKQGNKALNDPARILSRFGLLRALNRAGVNEFDAYRVEALDEPRRWPVFLRVEGDHDHPVSALLHDREELEAAVQGAVEKGLPRSRLLIIEYAAEPVRPGLFRKLSVFRIGDQFLGYSCVHDDQWIVKYGKPGIATPELYEEEYELVATSSFADALRPAFEIAGVEYGRVDFGLVGGRPQIYEINSNPHVELKPKAGPVAIRNQTHELFRKNYLAALRAIDTSAAAAIARRAKKEPL